MLGPHDDPLTPRKVTDESIPRIVLYPGSESQEMWKPYPKDSRYEVSSMGKVYSVRRKRLLTVYEENSGYFRVQMPKSIRLVSEMVATTFLWTPECTDNLQVNHLDGEPEHNQLVNLSWSTRAENVRHGVRTASRERPPVTPSPVVMFDEDKVTFVCIYVSEVQAGRDNKIAPQNLRTHLKGRIHTLYSKTLKKRVCFKRFEDAEALGLIPEGAYVRFRGSFLD